MRHILWLLLAMCALVHAQSSAPSSAPVAVYSNVIPQYSLYTPVAGQIVSMTVQFTSSVALTGATLDIEVHNSAGAQVGQSWQTGVNFTAGQTVNSAAFAWQTTVAGTFTVEVGIANSAGMMLWFNNNAGTIPVSANTVTVPCLPKIQYPPMATYGALPSGVSTRYDTYAVWVCNLSAGYTTWGQMFTMANVAPYVWQYIAGTFTLGQAQSDCSANCVAPTASEQTFLNTALAAAKPICLVAFNGASLTRPVYGLTSTGTLNPTPLTGVTVAVGAPCDPTNRIPTAPSYYSVSGDVSTSGVAIPINSYTIGAISLPIGAN